MHAGPSGGAPAARRLGAIRGALLTWLLSARLAEGKVQVGAVGVGGPGGEQSRWQYLSKFGYDIGYGLYEVRLRLRTPRSIRHRAQLLTLHVYLDEDWERVQAAPFCERAMQGLSRQSYDVEISRSGEWSDWHDGALEQRVRPHIWYFALSNCGNLANSNETVEVEFELRARQEGGSEFGVEAGRMLGAHCVAVGLLAVFLVDYAARCVAFRKSNYSVHPGIWVLTGALVLQCSSQALHSAHLWRYSSDGVGAPSLDTLSESLLMASQVVHTTLLILIAQGYTLVPSKDDYATTMKMIVIGVLVVHAALVWFGKLEDDAWHKTHQNEGAVGWAILAFRLALFGWFVRAVRYTKQVVGMRQASFLQRFSVAGGVYFLAYPALFLFVQVLAPYLRHPVMQVGVLAMQLASDFWLAGLFLRRGEHFEVSSLSDTILASPLARSCTGTPSSSGGFSVDASPTFGCVSTSKTTSSPASFVRPALDQREGGAAAVRRRLSWADEVGREGEQRSGADSPQRAGGCGGFR